MKFCLVEFGQDYISFPIIKIKIMKVRTCPHCDYKYTIIEYLKSFFITTRSELKCINCESYIKVDFSRRVIIAVVFLLLIIATNVIVDYFELNSILWVFIVLAYIPGTVYIFTFDTFKKVKE